MAKKSPKKRPRGRPPRPGLARGKEAHAKRSQRARTLDNKKKAKRTLSPTRENFKRWQKRPNRYDLKGVDTPKGRGGRRKKK